MAMHRRHFAAIIVLALAALTLTACASTALEYSWRDPKYQGPPLTKLLVVGISNQITTRRIFEDEFVAQLAAAGVAGVHSYDYIQQGGQVDAATLKEAVQRSGADGALVTRYVRSKVSTEVEPAYMAPGFRGAGFYGAYAGSWGDFYEPPTVYETVTVVLETNLYAVGDSVLVWSGTTDTFEPADLQKDIASYAGVIIAALKKQKLI